MGLYVLKIHISKISIFGLRTIEQKPATLAPNSWSSISNLIDLAQARGSWKGGGIKIIAHNKFL